MSDSPAHRDLLCYLTADLANEYLEIMDDFAGTLLTELSPSEVAASLKMDIENVEIRCLQPVR